MDELFRVSPHELQEAPYLGTCDVVHCMKTLEELGLLLMGEQRVPEFSHCLVTSIVDKVLKGHCVDDDSECQIPLYRVGGGQFDHVLIERGSLLEKCFLAVEVDHMFSAPILLSV